MANVERASAGRRRAAPDRLYTHRGEGHDAKRGKSDRGDERMSAGGTGGGARGGHLEARDANRVRVVVDRTRGGVVVPVVLVTCVVVRVPGRKRSEMDVRPQGVTGRLLVSVRVRERELG